MKFSAKQEMVSKKKINGCLIGVSVFKYCTVITQGDIIQNLKYVFYVNNYTPSPPLPFFFLPMTAIYVKHNDTFIFQMYILKRKLLEYVVRNYSSPAVFYIRQNILLY